LIALLDVGKGDRSQHNLKIAHPDNGLLFDKIVSAGIGIVIL